MSVSGVLPRESVSAEDLAELMRAFNAASAELGRTHEALRGEVARLKGELHEANRRLERSRRLAALGEMAAGIAHEVRNPLAAIALHAEMLREDLGEGEHGRVAGKILRAARDLDGVVGDVLRFARELELHAGPVDAVEPARRAVGVCEALARGAGVGVVLRGEAALGPVEIDAGLVAQALANLIRNSIEAIVEEGSDGSGMVELSVSLERDRVVYEVGDNGPGLPQGALDRMFNPFYTTRQTGCGLGLAMVQRIVDAHGGHVDAGRSDAGGARFVLSLPTRASRSMLTEGVA